MTIRLLGLAAAFTLSFWAGRSLTHAESAPALGSGPPKEVAGIPASELPRDCDARQERIATERERLEGALEAKRLELRMQAAAREAREGPVHPWPDDLDPMWQPSVFQAAVREAAAEVGTFDVVDFDCDEFPCLTILRVAEEYLDIEGMPDHHVWDFTDGMKRRGYTSYPVEFTSNSPRGLAVVTWAPGLPFFANAPASLQKRVRFRSERIKDILMADQQRAP